MGIISARFHSTRFPGKPLAILADKPLIQHVYERASKVLKTLYVATDDERISTIVNQFGGKVVLTSSQHLSGTDRCAEAIKLIAEMEKEEYQYVINIQGDEPFIHDSQIKTLMGLFTDHTDIATLVKKIDTNDDIFDTNKPKVVFDKNSYALYFTRSPVPFVRNIPKHEWPGNVRFYKHIGIYAYRSDILKKISQLPPSDLENAESLEQLRWLQNGFKIKVGITEYESFGIDTPDDLEKAQAIANQITGY